MKHVTYSHDAIRVILGDREELWPCDRCKLSLIEHTWITLAPNGSVVGCSGSQKPLTDGTGVG